MGTVLLPWVIAATLLLFVAIYWIYTLEKRFKALEVRYQHLASIDEETDEATLIQVTQRLEEQGMQLANVQAVLATVEDVLPHVIQGYGTVRYNAFPNAGGEQSFSVALVDIQGNGVVMTGLHGREMRVYAKPLVQWRASHSLSSEEQEALALAREMLEREG
jgi:hypothetical protein